MAEKLLNKLCEDLEDLLQCPICFICPNSKVWIWQCVEGHTICEGCMGKLPLCPTCNKGWSITRNRLATDLCSKLADLKQSFELPDRCCAATQTNLVLGGAEIGTTDDGTAANDTSEVAVQAKGTCRGPSGLYPCCIGNCQTKLAFDPLSDHILTAHLMHFLELPLCETGIVFEHTWPVEFTEQFQYDRAFRIPRVGMFFVKLSTNQIGDFTGFLSMINSAAIAKQFSYELKIICCSDHRNPVYTGDVSSCRTPITDMGKKCLQVKQTDMEPMMHIKVLKCTMILTKKLYAEVQVQPKKKNRPRNSQYRRESTREKRSERIVAQHLIS